MARIRSVLEDANLLLSPVTESALLEAEILLCKVMAKDRSFLRAWPDKELTIKQLDSYKALLQERKQGRPVAYILGSREFWSREFQVSPDVLIPRPDTELLIEISLTLIPKDQTCKVIDLGTGSGIIAVTLASERPDAQVSACDLSVAALQIAKANAIKYEVKHIQFYRSNWFDNVPDGKFNLIVSNPPYIAEEDEHLTQGDLRFEPKIALIAAQDGLSDIGLIAGTARNRLEHGGYLLVEHGYNQQDAVQSIFKALGYYNVQTHIDLSGQPRVTSGQYPASA